MKNRGNHSIEFCELERGLHELDYSVFAFEPPQRMDGVNEHFYEPQHKHIAGFYRDSEFLFGCLRGFMPRYTMPMLEDFKTRPRWGWQHVLDRAVVNRIASENEINKKFGITLATDINPRLVVGRSEDFNAYASC